MNLVPSIFNEKASGSIRPLDWEVSISWTKQVNPTASWFMLGQSQLDGVDILSGDPEGRLQPWDLYDYTKFRERAVEINIERSITFPYNVQSAVCDVKLDNHDFLFSYASDSSIADYILPDRPIRVYLGFKGAGLTPVFVGYTEEIPSYSESEHTATVTAFDPLSMLAKQKLPNMVMLANKRTDQILANVFTQLGIPSSAYNLSQGLNTIPFVFYEAGKDVGNIFKELIEAEAGFLWVDENGTIRFEPRTASFIDDPVMDLDKNSIISIKPKYTDYIYNSVYIEADVRVVQNKKQVFEGDNSNGYSQESPQDDNYRINSNSQLETWINLNDPCITITTPIFNGSTNDSYITAVDLDGDSVSSGVTITGQLFGDSYKLTVTNSNNYPISLNKIVLFGEPAEVLGGSPTIKYEVNNAISVANFGTKQLKITDNKCFGSLQNAKNFANFVLDNYSDYNLTIEIEVKGNPALQLQDIVSISGTEYDGTWLVTSISNKLTEKGLETKLVLHRGGAFTPFILDQSMLNSADVLS